MIQFSYLHQGLCGLANAHRASAMAGHLGAAVVAGYFFGEDQAELDQAAYHGVEQELDRVIQGEEAFWFNAKRAGITAPELFDPLPKQPAQPETISTIAEALAKNIGQMRQSGHNVIFAAIALRALHDHPEYATPATVTGIRKLIASFDTAHAGRGYYGKAQGWRTGPQVQLDPANNFPPYQHEAEMANVTIDELIATASVRKQGFGGLWHIINHAAAITELSRFGYQSLAKQGLPAHHHHIRLWRSLPDVEAELGPQKKADHDPRQPVYWEGMLKRDEARLTHRVKTLYGFFALLRLIEDEKKRKTAEERFLYLMD